MNRAKFLMFAALAVACAASLTLSEPADARLIDGSARVTTALAAIRLSGAEASEAMALAGFAVLVCSSNVACGR